MFHVVDHVFHSLRSSVCACLLLSCVLYHVVFFHCCSDRLSRSFFIHVQLGFHVFV